jgi:hypothetical protein
MPHRLSTLLLALVVAGCVDQSSAQRDSARRVVRGETSLVQQGSQATTPSADTQSVAPVRPARASRLSPGAQSVADALVFVPRGRNWFALSVRSRRLVVDLGRADIGVPRDSSRREAFRAAFAEAAAKLSPVKPGTKLSIRGPWGIEQATVADFDIAGGRIVGRLQLPAALATLVRRNPILPGAAQRVDTMRLALAPDDSLLRRDSMARRDSVARRDSARKRDTTAVAAVPACIRDSVDSVLVMRTAVVRDSLEHWLTDSVRAAYPRLEQNARVKSWTTTGCFRVGRVLVLAARHDPSAEFAVERAVVLDDSGRVMRLRVADLRFRVHEPLAVFDADGDGVDDVATRALGERSGGITILRFDTTGKRLERLASGFSWESR